MGLLRSTSFLFPLLLLVSFHGLSSASSPNAPKAPGAYAELEKRRTDLGKTRKENDRSSTVSSKSPAAGSTSFDQQRKELLERARKERDRAVASARLAASSVAEATTAELEVQKQALRAQAKQTIDEAAAALDAQKRALASRAKVTIDDQQRRAAALVTSAASSASRAVDRVSRSGDSTITMAKPASSGLPDSLKLIIGAGGIYAAFLYYGSLQEDVFRYTAPDGTSFKQAWFLQVLEALANVIVGFVGMQLAGPTKGIPLKMFAISGAAQVSAKACTSLALANGLSFPVATLAKSGKMAPVMAGSLLLGGATYTAREYLQVAAIIGGTAIVSMGKKKGGGVSSSTLGVVYIILSLVLDGVTAGFQKRLKTETAKAGVKPKPYDFMFWTNLFMALTAAVIAGALGEIQSGLAFCTSNPEIFEKIVKFAVCSAVGQSFIFYTIANFDPLVLSTVTTTRKIFSVLLSIFLKGHSLSPMGWSGICLACAGILSEMHSKTSGKKKTH